MHVHLFHFVLFHFLKHDHHERFIHKQNKNIFIFKIQINHVIVETKAI